MNKGGYITLIEFLIIIALIGLLSSISIPTITTAIRRDKLRKDFNVTRAGSGIWYNLDTKEVVQVSTDYKKVLATIGKIKCPLGQFESMRRDEQVANIDYGYKPDQTEKRNETD